MTILINMKWNFNNIDEQSMNFRIYKTNIYWVKTVDQCVNLITLMHFSLVMKRLDWVAKRLPHLAKFAECIDFPASYAFCKGSNVLEFTKFLETQKKTWFINVGTELFVLLLFVFCMGGWDDFMVQLKNIRNPHICLKYPSFGDRENS